MTPVRICIGSAALAVSLQLHAATASALSSQPVDPLVRVLASLSVLADDAGGGVKQAWQRLWEQLTSLEGEDQEPEYRERVEAMARGGEFETPRDPAAVFVYTADSCRGSTPVPYDLDRRLRTVFRGDHRSFGRRGTEVSGRPWAGGRGHHAAARRPLRGTRHRCERAFGGWRVRGNLGSACAGPASHRQRSGGNAQCRGRGDTRWDG